jgi:transcriptional regulator of acetoin/glycerol metabolism
MSATFAIFCATDSNRIEITMAKHLPTLQEIEDRLILQRLKIFRGNRAKTASSLGISLRTLCMKVKRFREMGLMSGPARIGRPSNKEINEQRIG